MFSYIQIFVCIISYYHTNSKPLGEIGFKRNFEVLFKPLPLPPLKPIGLIKEFWGPWGRFGKKHGIEKRDLDRIKTVEAQASSLPPPMSLNRYEVEEPKLGPLSFPPPPLASVPVKPVMGPVIGPVMGPVMEVSPVPASPHPVVLITPPPPKQIVPIKEGPPTGLYTDINRDDLINEYLKSMEELKPISENNIVLEKPKNEVPVPPPIEGTPNPFVRGSRLALYYGNILLEVLSQFLGGARAAGFINRPVTI